VSRSQKLEEKPPSLLRHHLPLRFRHQDRSRRSGVSQRPKLVLKPAFEASTRDSAVAEVDVVVVADRHDEHGVAIISELDALSAATIRFNLNDLRQVPEQTQLGAVDLLVDGNWRRVSQRTTVWWRRAGTVETGNLGDEEARLVWDEAPHVLRHVFRGRRSVGR
jgi:hypothetical protein